MAHNDVTGPTRKVGRPLSRNEKLTMIFASVAVAAAVGIVLSLPRADTPGVAPVAAPAAVLPAPVAAPIATPPPPQPPVEVERVEVSAVQLDADYEANEVHADALYRNRLLRVVGKVASIDRDFTDAVIVLLRARDFSPVHAEVVDADVEKARLLHKGQLISVECVGRGRMVSRAMLGNCTIHPPPEEAARREAVKQRNASRPQVIDLETGKVRYLDGK